MRGTARHQALLEAGGEVVTATPRQARWLKVAFGRAAARRGLEVWATPRITPLGAWLEREVRALDDRPQILDGYAASRLWELIVADSPAGATLVGVKPTAAEAARAWALAHEWQIPIAALRPATAEEAAFRDWALEFERRTAARGAIDAPRLAAFLAARPGAAAGRTPLGFHGFDHSTPAHAALAAALSDAGCDVVELALEVEAATPASAAPVTPEAECALIATWLAARLGDDPAARLVVIVPDLAARAAALGRLLDDRLAPGLLAPGAADGRPYAMSIAPSLAGHAVVDAALDVIGLGTATLDLLDVGRLLRSPYLPADERARGQRARLDVELRRQGLRTLPGQELARRVRGMRAAEPAFTALVDAVRARLAARGRQTPAEWADAMQAALRAVGWPLGRALGTVEYQAARAVHEALAALGGLSGLLPPLDFGAARAELRALLSATAFQPDLGDAPVLVLERLEDPALPCDGLWVAGLTADRFPATMRATPFLPLGVQRARGIPATTPAGALGEARRALDGWRRCAPELVLSAPRQSGDARLLRSALIVAVPALELPPLATPRAEAVRAARRLVRWSDTRLPPVPAGTRLDGGVGLLNLQSSCPFRAGIEIRLAGRALERPATGISRKLRGTLAHAALAAFWREIGSQAELEARGDDGRAAAARAAVATAFDAHRRALPRSRLVELERRWLERAIAKLAEHERSRAAFEVVEREAEHDLEAGGFRLGGRIDRVDRLADGATVVIDYKTGRRTPRRWLGPRPDAMQLAAYALSLAAPPAAVAFALLPLSDTGFVGLAARDALLPRVRSLASGGAAELRAFDWPGLIAEWRRLAAELAAGHAAGEAAVDPAPEACERCPLPGLCRIDTPASGADAEEGDGD